MIFAHVTEVPTLEKRDFDDFENTLWVFLRTLLKSIKSLTFQKAKIFLSSMWLRYCIYISPRPHLTPCLALLIVVLTISPVVPCRMATCHI